MTNLLKEYARKRNFRKTSEPAGKIKTAPSKVLSFVVQEHHASHLHYDFRLELQGVLKSWAIPKGPVMDPKVKRLAVQVEDHPLEYGKFHGTIPKGEYGAGKVYIWDSGNWEPIGDPVKGLKSGRLEFSLMGKKLRGKWILVRTSMQSSKPQWLLIKRSEDVSEKNEKPALQKLTSPKKKSQNSSHEKSNLKFIAPELCRLVEEPPTGDEWIHEMKLDGYRIQAHRTQEGEVFLYTRTGLDWKNKYPSVAEAVSGLDHQMILDGEIVALDAHGRTDFQALQNAMEEENTENLYYYVFDLLHLDGKDLRQQTLLTRKESLAKIIGNQADNLRYSEHIEGTGEKFFKISCQHELEGIVSKLKHSVYSSRRSGSWVKSKCSRRQEFVIGGFTAGTGTRQTFGALLIGFYEEGKLRYAGKVGTGFNAKSIAELLVKLKPLIQKSSPFEIHSPRGGKVTWVKPRFAAEIKYGQMTKDKILRVPVFQGLREDKPARDIIREKPTKKNPANPIAFKLTHPEKIIYRKEKITKQDIADFYRQVAPHLLPHLRDRPLSLKRCPNGSTAPCFFQKHALPSENLHGVEIPEKSGTETYVTVDSVEGLLELVQMGAFEIHAWNCRQPAVERPDQIVLDFDPSPGVTWEQTKRAAFDLKKILDGLNLQSFVKTSGGKGLHVHVPFSPIYSWDDVKEFSKSLGQEMVDRNPKLYTVHLLKKQRTGKIFVDYLRNGRSQTAVAAYSLRMRESSAVALPLEWTELKTLRSSDFFTYARALEHVKKRKRDPWDGYLKVKQKIKILKPAGN